jgi:hypothetical protein
MRSSGLAKGSARKKDGFMGFHRGFQKFKSGFRFFPASLSFELGRKFRAGIFGGEFSKRKINSKLRKRRKCNVSAVTLEKDGIDERKFCIPGFSA